MINRSTRTTGNEPVGEIDPGGTRPKPAPAAGGERKPGSATDREVAQDVRSGDQNEGVARP